MKLTGREGELRIYDSSAIAHGTAPLASLTMDVVTFDGGSTWANKTTECAADDTNYANDFLPTQNAKVYIGSTSKFAMIRFLKGGGAHYAAGSGALIATYYNGSAFVPLTVVDGSASGGDCFAQDGYITFAIPRAWAIGANAFNANLDADKFYICLATTTASDPDADADILAPVDGQHFVVKFAAMDFNGPLGRPLQEEQLVLNRQRVDAYAHYIKGPDDVLYQAVPISFSALLDDTYNNPMLGLALECNNPNTLTWTGTGVSSKGDTKNDGTNANPAFADATKKTVNIQMLWTGGYPIGRAYYECFFPKEEIQISEAEDGIKLVGAGGCFGAIERIYGFGNRY